MNTNSCIDKNIKVTINVVAPPTTPLDATLFIAGNHIAAGDWNPGLIKLDKQDESRWAVVLLLPQGYFFEFKITRGTWNSQAIYVEGEISPNNQINVDDDTTITLQPLNWRDFGFTFAKTIVGTVKYHRELKGVGLNYPRDLIVWLPPSYDVGTSKHYPVLYMHDGQNIIDPATSFIGYDWHIDAVADSLIRAVKMKEIIVVGIYNTPDRNNEYDDYNLGHAYMRFVVENVKKLIDSTYRTMPDRQNTAVMGSSMGGLISFLLVWNYPEVFSQAGCVSPLFRESLTRTIENYKGQDKQIRIYIDNGEMGLDEQLQQGCDNMLGALQKIGFVIGENLEWYRDTTAEHNEHAWAKRVWRPLLFMYENR
ncbi:MAG: histidine kinase [Ignavibacteriales bacterium]|nr:histidine kinase [Ignavibacteriales bacterium]